MDKSGLVNTRNWLLANKLNVNVTKTEYNMFFGTGFRLSNVGVATQITLGDMQINRVKQTKYLGVYLGGVYMRKLAPVRVSYRHDFLISYRVYMMTGLFHISLFDGTLHVDKMHV